MAVVRDGVLHMTTEDVRQGQQDEHPLESLSVLTPTQVQSLKARWIGTVEAVVSAVATPSARAGMAEALGVSARGMDGILDQARALLGEERFQKLSGQVRGGPLGALLTEEQKKDFGIK
jgi:hypothetical protein